jgi:hypothetical protein
VLAQCGWSRVRGGDNEYWRRPGKDSGTSATLKDRVFYVFSSNAAPFEPNRAYSPFAVYTLLHHGGDFEQAARCLGQLGFGCDSLADSTTGADISAIVRMSAAHSAWPPHQGNPGRIPELFRRSKMAASHAYFRGIGEGVARLWRGWPRSRGGVAVGSLREGRPACRSLRAPCGSAHNGLRSATGSLSGRVTMLVYLINYPA